MRPVATEGSAGHSKGQARRQLVVDAAAKAISELGLANVRVVDIAERAGMTTGHVTYYFPAKTDLLMLAIRRSEESLIAQAETELDGLDDAWWRQILRGVLARGRDAGAFTFDDLDDVSQLISAAIDGLSIQLTVGAPGFDRERMLALCLRASAVFAGVVEL
jgi:AcrR family transcriptional regulator